MDSVERLKLLELAMDEDMGSSRFPGWAPPEADEIADEISGFKVRELIAVGGMGAVYEAVNKEGDTVAIKMLPRGIGDDLLLSSRFETESEIISSFRHENIVAVIDSGVTQTGLQYFVMEYVPGKLTAGPVSLEETMPLVRQLTAGLIHAHEKGIVHRDLKPSNLLLTESGLVKISDFGLAKRLDPDEGLASLTLTGSQFGTPHYMAPELVAGEAADLRSDIYSLGVIVYQLLTGRLPVGKYEAASRIVDLPKALDAVLDRAMEVTPARRYQTVTEFWKALEKVAARKSRKVPVRSVVAGLFLVISVAWIVTQDSDEANSLVVVAAEKGTFPWESSRVWGETAFEGETDQKEFVVPAGVHLSAHAESRDVQLSFPGKHLTLEAGSQLSLGGATSTVTIDRLVLDGGLLKLDWEDPGSSGILEGAIEVASLSNILSTHEGSSDEEAGDLDVIDASISGEAPLLVSRLSKRRAIKIQGDNRDFSGGWMIEGTLYARSPTALGSGPIQLGAGILRVPGGVLGSVELRSRISQFFVEGPTTVASLTIDGKPIPSGVYTPESELNQNQWIELLAELTVLGETRGGPYVYAPQTSSSMADVTEVRAVESGPWTNDSTWENEAPSRGRYTASGMISDLFHYRVPAGKTLLTIPGEESIQLFGGRVCELLEGSRLELALGNSVLIFPELRLSGGVISDSGRVNEDNSVFMLGGNIHVNAPSRFELNSPRDKAARYYSLVLDGKLRGDAPIRLRGRLVNRFAVRADTSDFEGDWIVESGALVGMHPGVFENATVKLLGGNSEISNLSRSVMRIGRLEVSGGLEGKAAGKGQLVSHLGWIAVNELIVDGEALPDGVYNTWGETIDPATIEKGVTNLVIVGDETIEALEFIR